MCFGERLCGAPDGRRTLKKSTARSDRPPYDLSFLPPPAQSLVLLAFAERGFLGSNNDYVPADEALAVAQHPHEGECVLAAGYSWLLLTANTHVDQEDMNKMLYTQPTHAAHVPAAHDKNGQ